MTYVTRNTFPKHPFFESSGLKISLCMYISPIVSERDKDHMIFKQLLQSIDTDLKASEKSISQDILIQKVEEIRLDPSWFEYRNQSIVIYMDIHETSLFVLQTVLMPFSMVSNAFYMTPLLMYYDQLHTYVILALEADDFQLFIGNRHRIEKIDLRIETSLHDIFSDQEKQQHVSHGPYGGASDPSTVHGHGSTKDLKDVMKMKFFSYVDRYLIDQDIMNHAYSLILLTSEFHEHDYKKISKHPYLLDDYIKGSLKSMHLDDVILEINAIDMKRNKALIQSRILRYGDLLHTKQSSDDMHIITKAILEGNIETLLIKKEDVLENFVVDDIRHEVSYDHKHHDDLTHINYIMSIAFSKGSEVLLANQEDMKAYPTVIAIFRYPV